MTRALLSITSSEIPYSDAHKLRESRTRRGNALEQLEKLIPSSAYAQWRKITDEAAAQERYRGTGPKFIKVGRRVYYRARDIEEWLDANTRTITGDAA